MCRPDLGKHPALVAHQRHGILPASVPPAGTCTPFPSGELTRIVADLQLFAVHAQDAAMRILTPSLVSGDRPSLTPRELEALRWTMDGKTAWEVANVLGISERTAVLHINNAMHKLDCVNKHQAVLKALRLGLIR